VLCREYERKVERLQRVKAARARERRPAQTPQELKEAGNPFGLLREDGE